MNKNTMIFITLSAVFGLGAMFIAKNWLNNNTVQLAEDQASVAVANVGIPTGTILEAKHVSLQVYPASMVPDGAISALEGVIGKIAKDRLYRGEIVRDERLATKGEGSALASLITENMRAVSIRVNDVVGVAGFLLPGNRVDILNTFQIKDKIHTEVILANVKILAIDQKAAKSENKPQLVRAVTVEVNLEQAETLMNARSRGSLQLALRNPVDNNEVVLAKVKEEPKEEVKPEPVKPEPIQVAVVPTRRKQKIEIIRGVAQESVQVRN